MTQESADRLDAHDRLVAANQDLQHQLDKANAALGQQRPGRPAARPTTTPAALVDERMTELRGFVRERRSARGLSLRTAAVEIGVPFTTITGFEKGERTPDSPALLALLAWLGLSLDWLTGGPSDAVAEYRRGWDDCAAAGIAAMKRDAAADR